MTGITRLSAAVLITSLVLTTIGYAGPGPATRSEPSGPIEFYARPIGLTDNGATARAVIEVTIFSRIELGPARLRGAIHGRGFDELFGIPDDLATPRRYAARKVQYRLDLEKGLVHPLTFSLAPVGGSDTWTEVQAHLVIDLDPDNKPYIDEDVIEYRARMGSR